MNNPFQDMQKMSPFNTEATMKFYGEWTKSWQTMATDMADYSKRSFEAGTQTFEKLVQAKSVEQAVEIQTTYAKRAYDEYMQQMSKIGGMYTTIAKDAYKPVETALTTKR